MNKPLAKPVVLIDIVPFVEQYVTNFSVARNFLTSIIKMPTIIERGESTLMQKKKWHVLIVDDELRIGTLINKLIHWDEFNLECVDVVDNGEKASEIIQSDRCPDIVLTDIRMPKISGLDLIRMTREHHRDVKFNCDQWI